MTGEIFTCTNLAALARHGKEFFQQEAYLALCVAAAAYRPDKYPGVTFGAFARLGLRMHLRGLLQRLGERHPLWWQFPDRDSPHDDGPDSSYRRLSRFAEEVPDIRTADVDPLLSAWHDEDAKAQRKYLDVRSRVILYLAYVECWSHTEISRTLRLSKERVGQLIERAADRLAAVRSGDFLLSGRPDRGYK